MSRGGGAGGGGEGGGGGGGGEHTLVDSMANTQDTVLNIVSSSNTLLQIMIQINFQKRKKMFKLRRGDKLLYQEAGQLLDKFPQILHFGKLESFSGTWGNDEKR